MKTDSVNHVDSEDIKLLVQFSGQIDFEIFENAWWPLRGLCVGSKLFSEVLSF